MCKNEGRGGSRAVYTMCKKTSDLAEDGFPWLTLTLQFFTFYLCASNNRLVSDHYNLLPFGVSQLWDFEIIGIVVNALGEK